MMFNKNIKTGIIMDKLMALNQKRMFNHRYCNFIVIHNKHLKALKEKINKQKVKNQKLLKFVLIKINNLHV